MHGYSRLGTGRASGGSPPSSPRFRHGRNKSVGGGAGRGSKQSIVEKVVFILISTVFRRRGVLLLAPLLYISGMLLYMGSVSFDVVSLKNGVVVVHKRPPPGSVYRSPQVFEKLWPFMEAESNGTENVVCCFCSLLFILKKIVIFGVKFVEFGFNVHLGRDLLAIIIEECD